MQTFKELNPHADRFDEALPLKEFQYKWLHLPSGKSGTLTVRYNTEGEFLRHLIVWNTQQPLNWFYGPLWPKG